MGDMRWVTVGAKDQPGAGFIQEPQERPYGVEAIFRDDNGNWYSLTERSEELDFSKPF